jgi:hypothetical protein
MTKRADAVFALLSLARHLTAVRPGLKKEPERGTGHRDDSVDGVVRGDSIGHSFSLRSCLRPDGLRDGARDLRRRQVELQARNGQRSRPSFGPAPFLKRACDRAVP